MRTVPNTSFLSLLHSTIKTIRTSRGALRLFASIALVTSAAIALGSTPSSANLFSGAVAIFSKAPEARASAVNSALHSEETVESEAVAPSTTMSVERRGHTATRLNDGRALIAGGENSNGVLNESEIYDPTTSEFSTAGNLNAARTDQTATLLSDGRVLIAGGRNGAGALNTTEIFDPATGTFASGPNMSVARAGHSATLFADGRILFAGGDGNGSAEILAADLSSSTAVGSLGVVRSMHSAALLQDGRVLIIGGRDANGNELASGEVFDTPAGTFSAVDSFLQVSRVRALLRVLFDGKVQIIGGNTDGSMEVYDPTIERFGAYAHVLPETDTCTGLKPGILAAQTRWALFHNGQTDSLLDRSGQTITELGSSALVVGGADSGGAVLSSSSVLASNTSSISTDKMDYAPGETAHISGRGFTAGETVRVKIHEDPHTPQERGFDSVADADGNFTGDYLVMDYDLNMKFIVSARGLTSGATAHTTFTDSQPGTMTLSPASVSVAPGNNAVYGVSIAKSGNTNQCTLTLSLSYTGTAPVGTTPSFSPNPLIMTNLAVNSNLNIATTNTGTPAGRTQPGTYNFTVTATKGADCQGGAGGTVTANGTLIVTSPNVAPVASAVSISGTAQFNQLLTGNYTYSDADGDPQGASTFRWLRNGTTVVGTNQTYTTVGADVGQTLTFEVTPVAATGTSPGSPVTSAGVIIGKAPSTTTITCPASVTYNGAAQTPCSATATGTGGLNVSVTVVYGNNTNAGTATANASYAGDANHDGSTATQVTFTIDKAGSTTTITCPTSVAYDGSPKTPCTATATGAGSLNVSVTVTYGNNTNAGTATADATYAGDANHNGSTATQKTFTIDKAGSTTTISCPTNVTYDGSPKTPCTATATGAGSLNVSVTVTYGNNTNAGTATADATFAGDANHNGSTATQVTFTIDKASSTTTINCPTNVTYNGSPLTPCTATATGAGSLSVSVTVVYANNTNAGTATANATFAGDANHNGSTATQVTFTIDKASSSTTINCPTNVTYNGSPLTPCTASATGAGSLNVSVTVVYGNNTNAGTATADASYAGDANHNGSTATQVTFTIDKASSSTTINCPTNVTYNGSPQTPCSATATGAGGLNVSVTVTYGNNTNAGTATADATYAGDANHNGSTATQVTFTIDKAASSTTINCPTNVTYNGSPQTPCSATATGAGGLNVSVTVVYGNNTNAGTATADATYTGDANHNGSTATQVTFTIDKASSSTTINCPTNVTYTGSPLEPCTATATGAGGLNVSVTVVYANNTNAGTATADATYAGDANHNGSVATQVTFTIDKASSSTTINCPTNVTYDGNPQTPCLATATGAGGLNVGVTVVYGNNTNAGTATADATYGGDANHNGSVATQVTFIIDKAASSTTINCPTNVTYDGNPQTPCSATATGVGGLNVGVTVVYGNNTDAGTATADATYAGDANHNGSTATQVTFTIDKAGSSTTINCPTNVTYNGSPQTPCTATATGAGGLNTSVTVVYGNNTNAGTATADATYAGDTNHNVSTATQVTFTIDKAGSSTTINCPTNVTYNGNPQTPCTATATGAGGLNVSVTVVYGNNTNAGTASANATYAGDANHNGSTATQVTFTIDKVTLTASIINNPTKVYDGNTNATLTPLNFSISNLVSGQGFTVTKTTGTYNTKDVATAASVNTTLAASDFSPAGGTNPNNYNLPTSASGAGHITPKALSVTADNKSFLFGDPLLTLTASYNAFATGEGVGNLGGSLTFTIKTTSSLTVPYNGSTPSGTYSIVPSGLTSTNYAITFVNGTLTIGAWTITGFYQPVDMNTPTLFIWNTIKGGSTVPLKFNIYAGTPGPLTERKNVSDVMFGTVQMADIPCSSSAGIDSLIDYVANTGNTALRYDGTGAQFIQNWQTPKQANKCYQVRMTALDGSYIDAFFKTK